MKITIIGGSKGTGARLAALAAEAGHEVSALSRSGTAPEGVRAIAGMEQAGVARLVVQSSLGAGDSGALMPAPLRLVMKGVLAAPLADHNDQEDAVIRSATRWTIVRPTGLTNKPGTGAWRTLQAGEKGYLGGSISRDDLAAYLLKVLGDDAIIGAAVGISN